jgi:hypothetical protein
MKTVREEIKYLKDYLKSSKREFKIYPKRQLVLHYLMEI